jgi:hypothetical protein
MRIKVESTAEVNLYKLRWHDWPAEARRHAIFILDQPRSTREFLAQLPELRKSWLIERVEARLAAPCPMEEFLGNRSPQ